MYVISVSGVELYKSDNFIESIAIFKQYAAKFGIEKVDISNTDCNCQTLNINLRVSYDR